MTGPAITLIENLRMVDWTAYALLGIVGLLGLTIDGHVDNVFFRRFRYAFVRPNPFQSWLWLLGLLVLAAFLGILLESAVLYPSGQWELQVFIIVLPEKLRVVWFINILEEIFRFGTFFLLIKFLRPASAIFITTLLFTLAHAYYDLPLQQSLTAFAIVFSFGLVFLFVGLRFGLLTVYVFHVATNVFKPGFYVQAPHGWMWVNWILALIVAVPFIYVFKRAGLWGLGGAAKASGGKEPRVEAVPSSLET